MLGFHPASYDNSLLKADIEERKKNEFYDNIWYLSCIPEN